MTPAELLRPRYKVMINYPHSAYEIGEILCPRPNAEKILYAPFPEIFKKIEWWEGREKADLPEYIKGNDSGTIVKVAKWKMAGERKCQVHSYALVGGYCWFVTAVTPATEEEYNQYYTTKK